nr:HNH endonuclease family protein [Rhodococcus sp. JVH1]
MTHNWGSGDPRTSTAAWRRLRRTILERDNNTCTTCGQPATEVDHIRNTKAGGTDQPDNLTSTCRNCHLKKTQAEAATARAARRVRLRLPTQRHPGLK